MIHIKQEFDKFVEFLPELQNDEVYFISLSARTKYLNEKEREFYLLGRTEMFARFTAYDKDGLYYAMQKLESTLQHRKTRNGKEIPSKCLVVYANINPSSTVRAFTTFKSEMDKFLEEIYLATTRGLSPNFTPFQRIEKRLMNSIQKSKSRKCFIDVDFDVKTTELVREFANFLKERSIVYKTIKTKGGYHVMIDKQTLGKQNVFTKIQELHEKSKKENGEVCYNKNEMVPVPGTMQANRLVHFVEF